MGHPFRWYFLLGALFPCQGVYFPPFLGALFSLWILLTLSCQVSSFRGFFLVFLLVIEDQVAGVLLVFLRAGALRARALRARACALRRCLWCARHLEARGRNSSSVSSSVSSWIISSSSRRIFFLLRRRAAPRELRWYFLLGALFPCQGVYFPPLLGALFSLWILLTLSCQVSSFRGFFLVPFRGFFLVFWLVIEDQVAGVLLVLRAGALRARALRCARHLETRGR